MDIENGKSGVKLARRGAISNACVGVNAAIMALDTAGNDNVYLPIIGGFKVLAGRDCTDNVTHNDYEVQEGCIRGFLELLSGSETVFLLAGPASLTYVQYSMAVK